MTHQLVRDGARLCAAIALASAASVSAAAQSQPRGDQEFQYPETSALVWLVDDAASLVQEKGNQAFADLRMDGSRWRQGERYIFVLAPDGTMLVHADPSMEGTNQLALNDVNGKPIVQGLIAAATGVAGRPYGWYHYEWPVPGELLPRWKSSYVRLVERPSGARYIVGSGIYNDRMERAFVADMVTDAVSLVEARGSAAFEEFRKPAGRFMVKDTYVFVIDPAGIEVVNPAFSNLEGRSLLELKDSNGKRLVREMLDTVRIHGSGWVDYMWPKPGENASTEKSTFVSKARMGDSWVLVGCGVYLADAPKAPAPRRTMTADELTTFVRAAATELEQRGEDAFVDFRQHGSTWFSDDTYLFAWTLNGIRHFHAAAPSGEGEDVHDVKDVLGRPFGRMFLDAANTPSGEGWVHYMYPEPGDIFPTWKSTLVKRVTLPSGGQLILGSGIYNMQMNAAFIQDVVDRAASLVAARGRDAFPALRDKTGPFVFMDTYVFVDTPDGTELVNAGQPSLEGRNLRGLTDAKGTPVVDEYIDVALRDGSGWTEYYWYKPGQNVETRKLTYVRKVQSGSETFIVGSGFYGEETRRPTQQ